MTPPTVSERLEKLRAFIREHQSGGCHILSDGDDCNCLLCDVDAVAQAIVEQAWKTMGLLDKLLKESR